MNSFDNQSNASLLDALKETGGVAKLMMAAKLKTDFYPAYDGNGKNICRVIAILHLDLLNRENYTFAIDALSEVKGVVLEKNGVDGGRFDHAIFTEEVDVSVLASEQTKHEARKMAIKVLGEPLIAHAQRLKAELAFTRANTSLPFGSNDALSEKAPQGFLGKILERYGAANSRDSEPEELRPSM